MENLLTVWTAVPLEHEVYSIYGPRWRIVAEAHGWWLGTCHLEQLCEGLEDLSLGTSNAPSQGVVNPALGTDKAWSSFPRSSPLHSLCL